MRENRLPKSAAEPLFWTKGVWQQLGKPEGTRGWHRAFLASRPPERGGQARVTRGVRWIRGLPGLRPELGTHLKEACARKWLFPVQRVGSAPCPVIKPGLAHGGWRSECRREPWCGASGCSHAGCRAVGKGEAFKTIIF